MTLRRHLHLERLTDVEVLTELLHSDAVGGEDGLEPAGADVALRAGGDVWRVVVRTRELGSATSVCDGTETFSTPVVTDLSPA